MTTLAHQLLDELLRVAVLRGRYESYAREAGAGADFAPAIALMTAAIDFTKSALLDQDAVRCLQAVAILQGFEE